MASIESTASTKRKTKESVRVESLLPQDLRESSERLTQLLEDYYRFMNQGYQPSYELNSVSEERDIDTSEHYLDQIQKEIAVTIPRAIQADRVKLYKNLVKYYNVRGSTESIQTFFKILLQDEVEIYYPKSDMLIPSDGKWDAGAGRYLTNDGFLSDSKKLQDSFFYQKFSYVIRTGNNVEKWQDVYNKLVHPAGFIFFGEIFLLLLGLLDKSKMPLYQPGLIAEEDLPLLIQMIASVNKVSIAYAEFTVILALTYTGEFYIRRKTQFSDLLKFYDETPLQDFSNFTIQEGINKTIDRINVQSSVYPYEDANLIDDWLNGFHPIVWPNDGHHTAFL